MHRRTKDVNGRGLKSRTCMLFTSVLRVSTSFLRSPPPFPPAVVIRHARLEQLPRSWYVDTQRYDLRIPLHGFRYTKILLYFVETCRKIYVFVHVSALRKNSETCWTWKTVKSCARMSISKTGTKILFSDILSVYICIYIYIYILVKKFICIRAARGNHRGGGCRPHPMLPSWDFIFLALIGD